MLKPKTSSLRQLYSDSLELRIYAAKCLIVGILLGGMSAIVGQLVHALMVIS